MAPFTLEVRRLLAAVRATLTRPRDARPRSSSRTPRRAPATGATGLDETLEPDRRARCSPTTATTRSPSPRNRAIPANARSGLRRPRALRAQGHAQRRRPTRSGARAFRTPSLRNVAVRERFMHNGAFTKLRDVVAFYATRATHALRAGTRRATKFDDVPAKYRANVNVSSLPYNRPEGASRRLDDDGHRRDRGVPGDADRRAVPIPHRKRRHGALVHRR